MPEPSAAMSGMVFEAFKAGAVKFEGEKLVFTGKADKNTSRDFRKLPDGIDIGHLQWFASRVRVQEKLEAAWLRYGGAGSPLGLPVDSTVTVEREGDGWVSHFRGGVVKMDAGGSTFTQATRLNVRLLFKALHCVRRAEKGFDEIYGSVAFVRGAPPDVQTFEIPTVTFNKTNERIVVFNHAYELGAPTDVGFHVQLMEHDSGNRTKVREDIRKFYDDVERRLRTITDPLIGAELSKVGVGTIGDVLNVATFGLFSLLGMGDDVFNPGTGFVPWYQFTQQPQRREYSHPPDADRGAYAFNVPVAGVSNGQYQAYFDFSTDVITEFVRFG